MATEKTHSSGSEHLRRVPALAAAALAAALALGGCTSGDDHRDAPAPVETGAGTGTAAAPAPDATPTSAQDAPAALQTAEFDASAGHVTVALRSLTRDANGKTMTLRVAFTPDLDDPDDRVTLSGMNGFTFVLPVLLDRANLKRYSIIRGEGGIQDWLMNKNAETTDGVPLEAWFVFAAPEDDIDTINVTIDQWGIEFPDVPIEAAS